MNMDNDDKLMADAAKLATEIAPERDLWPEIKTSIEIPQKQKRGWAPYFAQAAAVVLLVGASSTVTYFVTKSEPPVPPVATNGNLTLESASWGGEYELSSSYKLARSDLRSDLDAELARLSPESRAEVEENLQVIRRAIAEINASLQREPDNVLLQDLLLKSYRQELAVMQKVGGLTQNIMSRNDI